MFIDAAHTATGRTRESRHTSLLASVRSVYGSFQARCIDAQWVASRRPLLQALARAVAENEDALVKLLSEEGHRPVGVCRTEARRSVQTIQKTEEALVRLAEPRALDFPMPPKAPMRPSPNVSQAHPSLPSCPSTFRSTLPFTKSGPPWHSAFRLSARGLFKIQKPWNCSLSASRRPVFRRIPSFSSSRSPRQRKPFLKVCLFHFFPLPAVGASAFT